MSSYPEVHTRPADYLLIQTAMQWVPSDYANDVLAFMTTHEGAAEQVALLHQIFVAAGRQADIRIGELISGFSPDSFSRLEFYVRIRTDRNTFNTLRQSLHDAWDSATSDQVQLVFPVIIRTVEDV